MRVDVLFGSEAPDLWFVEAVDEEGCSVRVGEWLVRPDGMRVLRLELAERDPGRDDELWPPPAEQEGVGLGWGIVEVMGHRRVGGRLSEQRIAGAELLRVDVYPAEGGPVATQFYGAAAIFSLTPASEEAARAAGAASTETFTRLELDSGAAPF